MNSAKRIVSFGLGALLLSGCVSSNAGYSDVRRVAGQRLDVAPRWNAKEPATTREVDKLLQSPLTVDTAGRIAVLNSPGVQAAFERLGVARAEWVSALALPNPNVGAALVYGIDDSPEVDIDASIDITGLILLASRSGVASARLEAAVAEVVSDVVRISYDAKRAFVEHQAALMGRSLRETIAQSWFASSEMARKLLEQGNVAQLRAANELAFYEEMRVQLARAEARARETRERLNAAMGLWGEKGAEWSLAAEALPEPVSEAEHRDLTSELERRALNQSLGVSAARSRRESFAKEAQLQRASGWIPELHAGVRVARQQDSGEPARWGAGPLVELGVPLFYQRQGETERAAASARREEANVTDVAVRTRAAARAVVTRLSTAAQMVVHYRDVILPLRGQVVEQTQLQFNAMAVGVFELLQAKNMEVAAHLAYLDVLRDYWTLRLDAKQLLAGSLVMNGGAGAVEQSSAAGPASRQPAHD